ncbi:membrane-associated protein, putative [Bodo saltans]|uniref:Membrane-associated protein, putative n=1 Tax=Bodo saltans TaxID=75058 RepID=A0A0S4J245_BODSA|nr:membrane-associated protein, putative [Bodo saltans]|eukprot:CUG64090.1 membrane-associated protein, putative [Bodo saltans]
MSLSFHFRVIIFLAAVFYVARGAFDTNLVKGGDSTVSGAYNYWSVSSDCKMSGGDFSVKDTIILFGPDYDCTMTQTIDITFARNYLLNPGGKVVISMRGYIQGGDPDYASLALTLLECISGNQKYTLGGNQLTSSSWNAYNWGMRLPPNICSLAVQLYLRNHAADGDTPKAQTISVLLTGTPATQSAALTATTTLTLTQDAPTPTHSLSIEMSPSALTTSLSPTKDHSPSDSVDITSSFSATSSVTSTGELTETFGLLTVSSTKTKTHSANGTSDTAGITITASATVSATNTLPRLPTATRSNTNGTLQLSTSYSLTLPLTVTRTRIPTPTLTWMAQPPTSQAPITVAASVSLVTVASAAALLAATGPATMQAIISNSACGNGTTSAADSPTMYLVSPFIGDSFAMVGGNIGLVFGVLLLHVLALLVARQTKSGRRSPRAAAALVRFPHITLLFANLAVQGTMLGGWQLLWLVIRGESNDDSGAKYVVCFVISLSVPTLLISALWKLRTAIVSPHSCSTFWRVSVAGRTCIHAKRIPYDAVGLSGLLISRPWLRSLMRHAGPTHLWTPRPHRLMFGAAVSDSGPHSALELRWLLLKNYVVPLVITAASAVRPPDEYREAVCAAAMSLTAVVMLAVGVTALWQRPFRIQFKNIYWPVSLLWIGLTALLSQPAVVSGMGDDVATVVLGVIGLLQSVTQAAAITLTCLVFLFVERRAAELVDGLSSSSCDDDDNSTATTASANTIMADLEIQLFSERQQHTHRREAEVLDFDSISECDNTVEEELKIINPLLLSLEATTSGLRSNETKGTVVDSAVREDERSNSPNGKLSSCSSSSAVASFELFDERLDRVLEIVTTEYHHDRHDELDDGLELNLLGSGSDATSDLLLGYHRSIDVSAASAMRRTGSSSHGHTAMQKGTSFDDLI